MSSPADAYSRVLTAAGELPTAAELLSLIDAEGYRVAMENGRSVLRQTRKGGDRVIVEATAKVLRREPYRRQALELVAASPCGISAPAAPPEPPDPVVNRGVEPEAERCPQCGAWVWDINGELICGGVGCPYRKATWGDPQAESVKGWAW